MNGEHSYRVHAVWTGAGEHGTTGVRDYGRGVTLSVPGKAALSASADRPFRGDPALWNPEDMLLAALSQCHLLSYLHACVQAGVVVLAYEDEAEATMTQDGGNGGSFTSAVLHPHVQVATAEMVAAAREAHEPAHRWCFIANSVNFPVAVEPVVTVAG